MNIQLNSNMFGSGFKAKRQKFGVGSLIFLLLFGAVFAGAGFFAMNSSKVDPSWTRMSGEVVDSTSWVSDGSTTHTAVVKYYVNGQEYRTKSNVSSSFAPTIGEKREIAYNPTQPNQAKVIEGTGATWWSWLLPVIGVAILIIAPVLFIRSLKRSSAINNLMQTGQKLQGILTDIQSTGSNDNNSYKIVVSATDNSGTVQNYVSDSIGGIGGLAMIDFRSNPIPVDVYIDPTNPHNYYVDIADIPNLTPQRITELIESVAKQQTVLSSQQQPTRPTTDNPQTPFPKL